MPATTYYVIAKHSLTLNGKTYANGATVIVPDATSFAALTLSGAADDAVRGIATVGQLPSSVSTFGKGEGAHGDSLPVQRIIRGF